MALSTMAIFLNEQNPLFYAMRKKKKKNQILCSHTLGGDSLKEP